jgi:hypothetical protein
MKKVIPKAYFFSARSGDLKFDAGQVPQDYNPVVVVWAAGSGPSIQWPSEDWTPRVVVDLSYKEDSTAREYALKKGAMYISGKKMFTSQAQEQRKFWKNVETGIFV